MRKLYEKNELTFAIMWIVIYCVVQSLANPLNEKIGIEYSASAFFVSYSPLSFLFLFGEIILNSRSYFLTTA